MELAYKFILNFLYLRSTAIVDTGQHDLPWRENMWADFCPPNLEPARTILNLPEQILISRARCEASERQTWRKFQSWELGHTHPPSTIINHGLTYGLSYHH
jgi:hypothetical protein